MSRNRVPATKRSPGILRRAIAGFLIALGCAASAAATTFTVTSTSDALGTGSLRDAITAANLDATASAGSPHLIQFAISGAGVQKITLAAQFPFITRPVVIDGFTQSGSKANTLAVGDDSVHLIEIDATGAAVSNGCFYYAPGSGGSIVRGLVVHNCPIYAFNVNTGSVAFEGNFLGIDPAGTTALGGGSVSLFQGFTPDPGAVTIGGALPAQRNVMGGTTSVIVVNNQSGVIIAGNYIGTNAAGTAKLGGQGIVIGSLGGTTIGAYTIGGSTAVPGTGAGNVISGNDVGITVNGQNNSPVGAGTIQGNIVGLTADGTTALGNLSTGIFLNDSSFNEGSAPALSPVLIGGTAVSGGRNVISGNGGVGVISLATGVTILGNYIGTDISGTQQRANSAGIQARGANAVFAGTQTIGGPDAGNLVSGNNGIGIELRATTAFVQGNRVGTKADGVSPLGNADIGIKVDSSLATIGGTTAGQGNTVSANDGYGIVVVISTPPRGASNAAILGNSIFANGLSAPPGYQGGLGINLFAPDLITPNDPGDADTGPNDLQNFPVLSAATVAGSIQGTLNSKPATSYRIEFFASAACDPSGYGEGQTYLGTQTVTTDGSGNASINAAVAALPGGQPVVTATATDPLGNTSEFSACVVAPNGTPPALASAASRKVHGGAGTFNLPLSLVPTNPTTEPRQGSAHTIVFTFDKAIASATASIGAGTAVAGAVTIAGNDVAVPLTGVANGQYVIVNLTGVAGTDGSSGGSASVRVGFLLGDVNGNRLVSVADLGLINAVLAQAVSAANYLRDVTVNGVLSVADKGVANAQLTTTLPPP